MGMISAEAADKVRNQPGAQRELEAQRHRSGLWLNELIHGRKTLVRELASYSTPAEQLELDAILDRADPEAADEIRNMIHRSRVA